jgi:hypothetical protein
MLNSLAFWLKILVLHITRLSNTTLDQHFIWYKLIKYYSYFYFPQSMLFDLNVQKIHELDDITLPLVPMPMPVIGHCCKCTVRNIPFSQDLILMLCDVEKHDNATTCSDYA